jgi:hypothetical protein
MLHLRQAALLQSEVSSLRERLAAFTSYLDRSPLPFLLTDAQCRVLNANAAANQTAGRKDGVAIMSGQLSVMSPGNRVAFGTAMEEAATGRGRPLRRIDVDRLSHDKPPYRLLLMPIPSSAAMPLRIYEQKAPAADRVGESAQQRVAGCRRLRCRPK